jgi:uncharacterized protein
LITRASGASVMPGYDSGVMHVGALTIHPIKSLDGVDVERATIAAHGGFTGDREYAIFDEAGVLVNGKRTAAVHTIRATYDLAARQVTLGTDTFTLGEPAIDEWLSEHFGFRVFVRTRPEAFADHRKRTPGPTLISTATLAVAAAALGLPPAEMRARFRSSIELAGAEPFEEDRFVSPDSVGIVRCGDVRLEAVDHCERCVVPSRDPRSGAIVPAFAKRLSQWREATLPAWTDRAALPHFYHLAVLTRVPATETGKTIAVGDEVRFAGTASGQRTMRDRISRLMRRLQLTS